MNDCNKFSIIISTCYPNPNVAIVNNKNISIAERNLSGVKKNIKNQLPIKSLKKVINDYKLSIDDIDSFIFNYRSSRITLIISTKLNLINNKFNLILNLIEENLYRISFFLRLIILSKGKILNKFSYLNLKKIKFYDYQLSFIFGSILVNNYNNLAFIFVDKLTKNCHIGFVKNNQISIIQKIEIINNLELFYQAIINYISSRKIKFEENEYSQELKQKYYKIIEKFLINHRQDGFFKINFKYFKIDGDKLETNFNFNKFFYENVYQNYQVDKLVIASFISGLKELIKKIILNQFRNLKKTSGFESLIIEKTMIYNFEMINLVKDLKIFRDISFINNNQDYLDVIGSGYLSLNNNQRLIDHNIINFQSFKNNQLILTKKNDLAEFLDNYSIKYFSVENQDQSLSLIVNNLNKNKLIMLFYNYQKSDEIQFECLLIAKLNPSNLTKIKAIFKTKDIFLIAKELEENKCYILNDENFFPKKNIETKSNHKTNFKLNLMEQKFDLNLPLIHNILNHKEYLDGNSMLIAMRLELSNKISMSLMEQCYKFFMSYEIDILLLDKFIIFKEDQVVAF